jgi:uncharacterized hydrophobic protein (TIGR00341 family)
MAHRMIEIYLPKDRADEVKKVLGGDLIEQVWNETLDGGKVRLKLVLGGEKTQDLLDALEKNFRGVEGFRVVLLPVEAVIPRTEEEAEPPRAGSMRVSREELYTEISDAIQLDRVYLLMTALSALVAAIGLVRSNIAVIIGAMVIAPLLGTNVGLALGTTLGDMALVRRALLVNLTGLALVFALSIGFGLVMDVDPEGPELKARTVVDLGDIGLALAAGSAGALAFTTGVPTVLIGVMVAVALLPPAVTVGMMVGSGEWTAAWGASLLLLTNLICVNLSGVVTFLMQGVRPLTWWESDRAKKATWIAILLWVVLLGTLAALILWTQDFGSIRSG